MVVEVAAVVAMMVAVVVAMGAAWSPRCRNSKSSVATGDCRCARGGVGGGCYGRDFGPLTGGRAAVVLGPAEAQAAVTDPSRTSAYESAEGGFFVDGSKPAVRLLSVYK